MTDAIKIQLLRDDAVLPAYQTDGSSGFDLKACFNKSDDITCTPDEPHPWFVDCIMLQPGRRVLIPTGIAMAIPAGFEGQVRSRSGYTLKQGLIVLNAPGTIDSDYRGEIGVIIMNASSQVQTIKPGDRIAQLVIAPVAKVPAWEQVSTLDETERGEGGYGSTGK